MSRQPAHHEFRPLPRPPKALRAGLCVTYPRPDLWSSSLPHERAEAEALCWRCPCRHACLSYSLTLPQVGGQTIYAATSVTQRLAVRRERQAALDRVLAPPAAA